MYSLTFVDGVALIVSYTASLQLKATDSNYYVNYGILRYGVVYRTSQLMFFAGIIYIRNNCSGSDVIYESVTKRKAKYQLAVEIDKEKKSFSTDKLLNNSPCQAINIQIDINQQFYFHY